MALTRYMLGEIRQRPGRTALTLIGIVIGVQSLVAVPISIRTTRDAHRQLFEGLTGKAALEVVPLGEGGFSTDLAARLETLSDVVAAVPVVQSAAAVRAAGGFVPAMTLGIEIGRDDVARDYVFESGGMLTGDGQVLLPSHFAATLGVQTDGTIELLTPAGTTRLRVAGLLAPVGAATVNAGAVAILPLSTAQHASRLGDKINALNLVLAEGADPDRVTDVVAAQLPRGLTVQVPAARAALANETVANTERLLAVLSIASLVAGAFVILNAFLMSLGERRRSLAILRAIGATRKQVSRLLLAESAALGVVGTAVGIPIGLAVSVIMSRFMADSSGVVIPQLTVTAGPFLLAGLLGPGVAILATWFPARAAGRRSPLADLRDRGGASQIRDTRRRRWIGFVGMGMFVSFVVVYTIILTCQMTNQAYLVLLPCGLVLALVGCSLIIPMALPALSRIVELFLRPMDGVEGRLAMRQLKRHPTRTTLVVSVVMISVMLSVGYGNAISNSVQDLRGWMVRVFKDVDFLVIPTALTGTELLRASMPEAYAEQIAELDGIRRVGKGCMITTSAADHPVIVFPRSCKEGEDHGFRIAGEDDDRVKEGLRRGEVVIGMALGVRSGLGRGDEISIATREGRRAFKIAGLTSGYTGGGMVVLMEWDYAKRFFDIEGARYIYVVADPADKAGAQRRVQAFCDAHGLLMHSRADFTATCDEMIAGVLGSAWALLALVFVVASLGITNCLTMNVLEQTRELGVLRAVAMQRRQVSKMILTQAFAMALIGAIPGAVLGAVLGYVINKATYPIVGLDVAYSFELWLLVASVAVAIAVSVLASLPPARRAGRLAIIKALQYE